MSYRSATTIDQLTGATIVNAGFFDDDDLKNIPVIVVKLPNGIVKTLGVMADPEGNAAGWLDIHDIHLSSSVIRSKPTL